MLLKLIACNVFTREACLAVSESPHVVDLEFTELGEHVHSDTLRALLQGHGFEVDEARHGAEVLIRVRNSTCRHRMMRRWRRSRN